MRPLKAKCITTLRCSGQPGAMEYAPLGTATRGHFLKGHKYEPTSYQWALDLQILDSRQGWRRSSLSVTPPMERRTCIGTGSTVCLTLQCKLCNYTAITQQLHSNYCNYTIITCTITYQLHACNARSMVCLNYNVMTTKLPCNFKIIIAIT